MKVGLVIPLEIEVDAELVYSKEYDDDGCGSSSKSGNSMTGSRDSFLTADSLRLNMTDVEIVQTVRRAAERHLDIECDEVYEALEANEPDSREEE